MRPIVKNFHSGTAGNEGNGMVGGKWWGCKRLGYKDVEWADIICTLDDVTLNLRQDQFRVEAYFSEGSDESVGMPYYCDLEKKFDTPEDTIKDIENAPISEAWKKALKALAEAYIDDLKDEEYTLYDD